MKKSTIFKLALLGIILSPFTVSAQTDAQYPAANFQPKVIFIDEAAAKATSSNSDHASAKSSSTGKKTAFDPKYPAASFEPKVIYPSSAS